MPLLFAFCLALFGCGGGSLSKQKSAGDTDVKTDSVHIVSLLEKGDSLYARRSGFATIAESMVYFDSAYRMAQRINDTFLLAYSLYYMGNVYNAWNKEPQTTLSYYQRAYALFNTLPAKKVKAFQLRYIIAHALDGEKLGDSLRCVQTIEAALHDLQAMPDSLRRQMSFLPDFAWVATNSRCYTLAEKVLNTIAPRYRIINDPQTNNYLDHYYLTRSRIDVYGYGRNASPYLDSLALALAGCANRFDSGYYSANLAGLYAATGNYQQAYRYALVHNDLLQRLDNSTVLSTLQKELLNRDLNTEREKQQRLGEELKNKNLYLAVALLSLLIVGLGVVLFIFYQRRQQEKIEVRRQQQFTYQLLQKEEEERKRIATDLHDGINHELLALKNRLLLQQPVDDTDVEAVITSVREVSRNLYPALFESVGLAASVEALCDRMTKAGFFTTCDLAYTALLTKDEELQVYRIVQEALSNVAKHAEAEACKITIQTWNNRLWIEIKDNGKGFDTARLTAHHIAFGLQSMQQRARAIGAQFSLHTNASGTVITLTKNAA